MVVVLYAQRIRDEKDVFDEHDDDSLRVEMARHEPRFHTAIKMFLNEQGATDSSVVEVPLSMNSGEWTGRGILLLTLLSFIAILLPLTMCMTIVLRSLRNDTMRVLAERERERLQDEAEAEWRPERRSNNGDNTDDENANIEMASL